MNQTTNYNFNVPVGSDIVNPLVQDFPNWESLDTILRNVANTGITTATHTKTGTIHTLTFSETSVPMIRFQATADFNTNDTFTVNGLSVSALTVSGEALPDGAFVIGSMVLCELRDNLLTVYTSGTDANTLEGHPASYFATASDLDTVDDKTDANRVLIDQINNTLSNIGTVYRFDTPITTNVPANTDVLVCKNGTMEPGTYLVIGYVALQTNSDGIVYLHRNDYVGYKAQGFTRSNYRPSVTLPSVITLSESTQEIRMIVSSTLQNTVTTASITAIRIK